MACSRARSCVALGIEAGSPQCGVAVGRRLWKGTVAVFLSASAMMAAASLKRSSRRSMVACRRAM